VDHGQSFHNFSLAAGSSVENSFSTKFNYISELPFGTCSQKAENSKKAENSQIAENSKKTENSKIAARPKKLSL